MLEFGKPYQLQIPLQSFEEKDADNKRIKELKKQMKGCRRRKLEQSFGLWKEEEIPWKYVRRKLNNLD
jgi:hypothetical protein